MGAGLPPTGVPEYQTVEKGKPRVQGPKGGWNLGGGRNTKGKSVPQILGLFMRDRDGDAMHRLMQCLITINCQYTLSKQAILKVFLK